MVGYLVTCNSTENWHLKEDVVNITDRNSIYASCERLVGYTYYKVQLFAFLNSDDGSAINPVVLYRSEAVIVRTLEGGTTCK